MIPFRDTIYILFGSFIYISDIVIEVMLNLQTLMLTLFVALGVVLVTGSVPIPTIEEVKCVGDVKKNGKACKPNQGGGHGGGGD